METGRGGWILRLGFGPIQSCCISASVNAGSAVRVDFAKGAIYRCVGVEGAVGVSSFGCGENSSSFTDRIDGASRHSYL